MKNTMLTLLLVTGMSFSTALKVMATPSNHSTDQINSLTLVNNSDCKGDKDDDCR